MDLIQVLEDRFRDAPEIWVGGDLLLYYREGDPRYVLCPDVLVVHGVRKWNRPRYLLWEERPPSLIVEVTSKSTHREDTSKKKEIYERIGVKEYVLFDPYEEYLHPSLQGFRLERSRYKPILLEPDGSLVSQVTGLILRREGDRLRLVEPSTGEPLRWPDEWVAEYRAANQELRQAREEARRVAETTRCAEQEAAEAKREAADAEQRAAEAEQRAAALEAEIARLRAERG